MTMKMFDMDQISYFFLEPFFVLKNLAKLNPPNSREDVRNLLLRNGGEIESSIGHVVENIPTPSWKKLNKRPFSKSFRKLIGQIFSW